MYQQVVDDLLMRRSIIDVSEHLSFLGDVHVFCLLFILAVLLCLALILFKLNIKRLQRLLTGAVYLGSVLSCWYCLLYPGWLEGRSPDVQGLRVYYPSRANGQTGSVNLVISLGLSQTNISIFNSRRQILFSEVIELHPGVAHWWFVPQISSVVDQLTAENFLFPHALRLANYWCWWILIGSLAILSYSLLVHLAIPKYGAHYFFITGTSLFVCPIIYISLLHNQDIGIYVDGQKMILHFSFCLWICMMTGSMDILFATYQLFTKPKWRETPGQKERISLEDGNVFSRPRSISVSLEFTQ